MNGRPLRTVSEFATERPAELSRQLAQLEQNVEDAIRSFGQVVDFLPVATNRKTAAYTAALGELVQVDTAAASVTVTLPVATTKNAGRSVEIARVSAANTLTVRAVTGLVNGAASLALTASVRLFILRSDGANWWSTL